MSAHLIPRSAPHEHGAGVLDHIRAAHAAIDTLDAVDRPHVVRCIEAGQDLVDLLWMRAGEMVDVGPAAAMVTPALVELVDRIVDAGGCRLDDDEFCQAHHRDSPCPHDGLKRWLDELGTEDT